jgi:hypothetical protein
LGKEGCHEAQAVFGEAVLKQAELGMPAADIIRKVVLAHWRCP